MNFVQRTTFRNSNFFMDICYSWSAKKSQSKAWAWLSGESNSHAFWLSYWIGSFSWSRSIHWSWMGNQPGPKSWSMWRR